MLRPIADGTVAWPPEFVDRYVSAGYWEGLPLGHHLWQRADRCPERIALVDRSTRLTYRQLTDRADAAASRLTALGLESGDRVLVQLPNGWEFVVLTLACLRAGIVPVMALPGHRAHELSHIAAHAEAAAVAVPDTLGGFDHQALAVELRDRIDSLRHVLVTGDRIDDGHVDLRALCAAPGSADDRARWDAHAPESRDVAVFLLSGGTTGLPKLIGRTHDDYAYNAKGSVEVCGFDAGTVYLVCLPAGHNFPLACPGILGTLLVGGRVVLVPSPEPSRAFDWIAREAVTHTAVVPAVAHRWLDHQHEHSSSALASLRVLQVGGARLAEEPARTVPEVLGCTLQQVFGMAEGLLNFTRLDDPAEIIATTQGRPMSPADEVLLVDERGRPVPDGEPGSLLTRGPYTPRGYYRAAEHNARAFTPDGWYRSGDVCRRHPSGNLVVEGRDKDIINRGGEKISAEEIENHAYRLAPVQLVAAVAMPDTELGERVCLYAIPHNGASPTLEEIRASMTAHGVAGYKLPERLVLCREIPMTNVGKIDKAALRADVARRLDAGDA